MRPELHIAWRYLFSKKGHNAINIVSGVSAAAVGVVTAAMVCVLSVMNGFGALVEHMFSEFDPEIRITAAEGKSFQLDTFPVQRALALPFVQATSEVVEEMALVRYKDHQQPARVMGVDSVFQQITHIDTIITDGYFSVFDGAFDRCVMGRGLATQIGVNAHFVGAVHLYAPKRLERVNMLRPDEAFLHEKAFMAGTFAVNQTSYDDQLLLVSLPLARRLFQYDTLTVTALELQLDPKGHFSARQMKAQLRECLGEGYVVADRYEQQSDFFRILKIEKLLTALLLAFILLIACFNVIGSLSMLIIDKQEDICILRHLGADYPPHFPMRRVVYYSSRGGFWIGYRADYLSFAAAPWFAQIRLRHRLCYLGVPRFGAGIRCACRRGDSVRDGLSCCMVCHPYITLKRII